MSLNNLSNFEKEEQSRKDHNTQCQVVFQGHSNQNSTGIRTDTGINEAE